jgi:hypothetical protein
MYMAHRTIKNSIEAFHKRFPNPPHWGPDLVTYYKWARGKAETEPEWKTLLNDLDKDITTLKVEWTRKWPRTSRSFQHGEESKAGFVQKTDCNVSDHSSEDGFSVAVARLLRRGSVGLCSPQSFRALLFVSPYEYEGVKVRLFYGWQATDSPGMLFPRRIFTCHHARMHAMLNRMQSM